VSFNVDITTQRIAVSKSLLARKTASIKRV